MRALPVGRLALYLEIMARGLGIARTALCILALLLGTGVPAPSDAQGSPDDAAAREYFERGRAAFEQADYESALVYFRHAYRLSKRGELQYNIGVTADRLQRETEALEAFEHYLEETESPTREPEVRERIEALRRSIAERDAAQRTLERASVPSPLSAGGAAVDGARMDKSAIVGSSVLASAGVAGVTAMAVGLARDGSCSETIGDRCVTERSTTAWTWVYGGVGLAALAGSATWLGVGAKRHRHARRTEVRVSPTGVSVRGTF
jgi:tetratricopeptide (TPR) repeat protein